MITLPQRVLGDALYSSAKQFPEKTAVIVNSQEYSYSALRLSADKLARFLIQIGIKKGDRVVIYMNNSWQSIISVYGITLAGAAFVIINPQTKADKLRFVLKDCGAQALISEDLLLNEMSAALDDNLEIKQLIISGVKKEYSSLSGFDISTLDEIIHNKNSEGILPIVIPNDLAALIYTSGSTGFPKGVMMSHQSMVFTGWSLIEYLRLSETDRILLVLPLAFDYGLYQLLMAITIGGTLIVESSFTFQASIYNLINIRKPTVFPGVPTIFALMITAYKESGLSFESITRVTNTAADLPAEFMPYLKMIFPNALIFRMYGLTECKRVCYLEPELVDLKPSSVGKAIPGTEVFILSHQGDPVPPGEKGILYVRGPHVMLGYWNNEEQSRKMLVEGPFPGERILCSHDWFKMDEEGYLYFLGRTDDIIKTRGEKVSPVEIEGIIYKIAGIKEVAIVGVPDALMGEAIIAFLTTHNNIRLDEKEILKECMTKLESFMIPKRILFLDDMPKSPNGKIDKKELKKMILGNEQA